MDARTERTQWITLGDCNSFLTRKLRPGLIQGMASVKPRLSLPPPCPSRFSRQPYPLPCTLPCPPAAPPSLISHPQDSLPFLPPTSCQVVKATGRRPLELGHWVSAGLGTWQFPPGPAPSFIPLKHSKSFKRYMSEGILMSPYLERPQGPGVSCTLGFAVVTCPSVAAICCFSQKSIYKLNEIQTLNQQYHLRLIHFKGSSTRSSSSNRNANVNFSFKFLFFTFDCFLLPRGGT